jgi:hypothetical protein
MQNTITNILDMSEGDEDILPNENDLCNRALYISSDRGLPLEVVSNHDRNDCCSESLSTTDVDMKTAICTATTHLKPSSFVQRSNNYGTKAQYYHRVPSTGLYGVVDSPFVIDGYGDGGLFGYNVSLSGNGTILAVACEEMTFFYQRRHRKSRSLAGSVSRNTK